MAQNKIRVKLKKSFYGYTQDQIGTVKALGLRRVYQVVEKNDDPVIRGMIFKVKHLVEIV